MLGNPTKQGASNLVELRGASSSEQENEALSPAAMRNLILSTGRSWITSAWKQTPPSSSLRKDHSLV